PERKSSSVLEASLTIPIELHPSTLPITPPKHQLWCTKTSPKPCNSVHAPRSPFSRTSNSRPKPSDRALNDSIRSRPASRQHTSFKIAPETVRNSARRPVLPSERGKATRARALRSPAPPVRRTPRQAMAKGAKRKTKWVSLSLANANTKTSNATGSDSEQTQVHHHQQQHHGEGHRHKMHNGATSLAAKVGKEFAPRTDVIIE
ncbi:AGAP012234-PA, partial [Anopheles gambiae str. PEST]